MRNLLRSALAVFVSTFAAAQTQTPILHLNTPEIHSLNWGGSVNGNFQLLDNLLGGTTPLPPSFWNANPASVVNAGALKLAAGATNTTAENVANRGLALGYAPLDDTGKVPLANLPPLANAQPYILTPAAVNALSGFTISTSGNAATATTAVNATHAADAVTITGTVGFSHVVPDDLTHNGGFTVNRSNTGVDVFGAAPSVGGVRYDVQNGAPVWLDPAGAIHTNFGAAVGGGIAGITETEKLNTANNGITATESSAACTGSACTLDVAANSTLTEKPYEQNKYGGLQQGLILPLDHLYNMDYRGQAMVEETINPHSPLMGNSFLPYASHIHNTWFTMAGANSNDQEQYNAQAYFTVVTHGGQSEDMSNFGGPGFKTTHSAMSSNFFSFVPSQNIAHQMTCNMTSRGDKVCGPYVYMTQIEGGDAYPAGEGAHMGGEQLGETNNAAIYTTTAASTSTTIHLNPGGARWGDLRNLLNLAGATRPTGCAITTSDTTASRVPNVTLGTAGSTNCIPNSTWAGLTNESAIGTDHGDGGAPHADYTVFSLASTNLFPGQTATISGVTSGAIACISDRNAQPNPTDDHWETVVLTVVDSTHVGFAPKRPHPYPVNIGVGGACEQAIVPDANIVDGTPLTSGGVAQVLIGVWSYNNVMYLGDNAATLPITDSSSRYFKQTNTIANLNRNANVMYVTTTAPGIWRGLTPSFSGTGASYYDGACAGPATEISPTSFTCPSPGGSGPAATTGTVTIDNSGYTLYPVVKIASAANVANHGSIDGTVPTFPTDVLFPNGASIYLAHDANVRVTGNGDWNTLAQYQPETTYAGPGGGQGVLIGGIPGPNRVGVTSKMEPDTIRHMLGLGGTAPYPRAAFFGDGVWKYGHETDGAMYADNIVHQNAFGSKDTNPATRTCDPRANRDYLELERNGGGTYSAMHWDSCLFELAWSDTFRALKLYADEVHTQHGYIYDNGTTKSVFSYIGSGYTYGYMQSRDNGATYAAMPFAAGTMELPTDGQIKFFNGTAGQYDGFPDTLMVKKSPGVLSLIKRPDNVTPNVLDSGELDLDTIRVAHCIGGGCGGGYTQAAPLGINGATGTTGAAFRTVGGRVNTDLGFQFTISTTAAIATRSALATVIFGTDTHTTRTCTLSPSDDGGANTVYNQSLYAYQEGIPTGQLVIAVGSAVASGATIIVNAVCTIQ